MSSLNQNIEQKFLSIRKTNAGFEGLTNNVNLIAAFSNDNVSVEKASLEDIIYYTKRGKKNA